MKVINCRFCGGPREVHEEFNVCVGCGMEPAECTATPEPPGKRPCPEPECRSTMVHWIDGFRRLKCVVCNHVFAPRKG